MKITADTNVLVRILVEDDEQQKNLAEEELEKAEIIALTLPVLCELAWVLQRGYRKSTAQIAEAIRRLIGTEKVVVYRPAVEAGLDLLDAGGDFADGVIAHEGKRAGADTFVSFDAKAVTLLAAQGVSARLLS